MKKIVSTLWFVAAFSVLTLAQSSDYHQELVDLINAKKWFEADRYYQQNKDSITNEFVKLYYTAETGKVFNKGAQSIEAYEKILDENFLNMDPFTLIRNFAQSLVDICIIEQDYAKGEELCRKMKTLLQNDTVNEVSSLIRDFDVLIDQFNGWNNTISKPLIIDKKPHSLGEVKLTPAASDNGIYFNAQWNGFDLRTYFDTGASGCFIVNRAIADKIGVNIDTADTILVNNGTIKTLTGVVDSLTFGKFSVKNVPVSVNIEEVDRNDRYQVACDSIFNSMYDIILGMSIIKKLGVIEFDFEENTMSFPISYQSSNPRNLLISASSGFASGTLFMEMQICDNEFFTFFDTGLVGGLSINTDFYERNKQHISVASEATTYNDFVGACNEESLSNRKLFECPQIEVQIQDKSISMINNCTVSISEEDDFILGTKEGGALGNDIFKYCSKAIFDFHNMVFNIEYKSQTTHVLE